jgi:hypothetical protein
MAVYSQHIQQDTEKRLPLVKVANFRGDNWSRDFHVEAGLLQTRPRM